MPRHGSQVARERLNILWEQLICGVAIERTPTDGHIEDVSDFKIDFHPQFDFESLPHEISGPSNAASRSKALIWFKPLDQSLLDQFPSKGSMTTQEFFDYESTKDDARWKCEDRTQAVYAYVNQCVRSRQGWKLSTLGIERSLLDYLDKRLVRPPSPFQLGPGPDGSYPQLDFWHVGDIFETMKPNSNNHKDKKEHAHALLAMQAWHSLDGHEDRILLGELYTIICAMRNRVNQRETDSHEEWEALWNFPADAEYRAFEFESETHFPVILLSYVGPQHGRIIYAYMDRHRLVICQSRLYSFEKRETAPVELFTRLLLSRPF